jgi:hypothetical protein
MLSRKRKAQPRPVLFDFVDGPPTLKKIGR